MSVIATLSLLAQYVAVGLIIVLLVAALVGLDYCLCLAIAWADDEAEKTGTAISPLAYSPCQSQIDPFIGYW